MHVRTSGAGLVRVRGTEWGGARERSGERACGDAPGHDLHRGREVRAESEGAVVGLRGKKRSGSHVRRVSGVLFGVSVRRFCSPLNACPPVGPEALQAWSLFQGTKAWLEPRLELTGTCRKLIPALCSSRSAVLARTSILRSERFTVFKI